MCAHGGHKKMRFYGIWTLKKRTQILEIRELWIIIKITHEARSKKLMRQRQHICKNKNQIHFPYKLCHNMCNDYLAIYE